MGPSIIKRVINLEPPSNIRRSFERSNPIRMWTRTRPRSKGPLRRRNSNSWADTHLNYEFLERCKECIFIIEHPNYRYKAQDEEYRVSVLRWSRGAYIDIRKYKRGRSSGEGILLHMDIWSVIISDIVGLIRQLEQEDTREDIQKMKPRVKYNYV